MRPVHAHSIPLCLNVTARDAVEMLVLATCGVFYLFNSLEYMTTLASSLSNNGVFEVDGFYVFTDFEATSIFGAREWFFMVTLWISSNVIIRVY